MELTFIDDVEASKDEPLSILYTDYPNKAIDLREQTRRNGMKCVIRDSRFFKDGESVEKCDYLIFLNSHKRDYILATYRQEGVRVKVADVPTGDFNEPVGAVEVPKSDTSLDVADTLAALPADEPQPADEAFGDELPDPAPTDVNDFLDSIEGEEEVDLDALSDDELKAVYEKVKGVKPHHLKKRETLIAELTDE